MSKDIEEMEAIHSESLCKQDNQWIHRGSAHEDKAFKEDKLWIQEC